MRYLMTVTTPGGITCWPKGTDAFGPSYPQGTSLEVEYREERVVDPRSGLAFVVVHFEDKGAVRAFEVKASGVSLTPLEEARQ